MGELVRRNQSFFFDNQHVRAEAKPNAKAVNPLVCLVGAQMPGSGRWEYIPGPFMVEREMISTYEGLVECFQKLFSVAPHLAHSKTSPNSIYAQHQAIPFAKGVSQVKELNYAVNFNAFFVDTMIFYLGENGWTEVYTVVFGQVKGSNLNDLWTKVNTK